MAPPFKTVVVFLVTLQLVQQSALSNKFYDSKDLNGPLNNKLTFHSRFNVLSSLKSKHSVKQEPQVQSKEELTHLNVESGSVARSRSKRQLDEDTDMDAEVFSNDPKMFSYGKSMPITTADDATDEHQHEKPESGLWNEDVDTTIKNSLGGLEDTPKEEDKTTNVEQDEENSESEKPLSTFHSQFQDISSANHDPTPKMTGEDNLSVSSSQTPQSNSSEIHSVPTLLHEGHVSKESETVESKSTSLRTDSELQHDASIDDDDNDTGTGDKEIVKEHSTPKSPELAESHLEPDENNAQGDTSPNVEDDSESTAYTESEPEKNEMGKDKIVEAHKEEIHSGEATDLNEGMIPDEKYLGHRNRDSEEILSKELDIDENEGELSEHLDKDDVDVFMHLPVDDSVHKTSGQLKLLEEDSIDNLEEGSGDMESDPTGSRETNNVQDKTVANGTDSNPSTEISSIIDNLNFNIDTDTDTDKTKEEQEENEYVDEDEDEKETESPIADPTDIFSKVDDPSKTGILSESNEDELQSHEEVATPDPSQNSSYNHDLSLTYDRKSIINPFNIDNASEISRDIGKAIGILDSSEETTDGEELEGSGEPFLFHRTEDKNSLENGAMFKIDPRMLDEDTLAQDYGDTTTNRGDTLNEKEVTEEPIIVHHHDDLLNAAILPENEDDVPYVTQNSANADEKAETATELGVTAGEEITHLPTEDAHETIPNMIAQIPPDNLPNSENGSVLPKPAGINEMGIQSGEKVASPENGDDTSSSSTGSFIVLGAIMATIVALLGYSVIKSYRQKRETSRKPPEDDIGTELKEIDTLLPVVGRNGHGPPNRLHVESDRLLGPSGENDKNDMKPDGRYPIYQNGVHGEDEITDKPNNGLQIDDPNDLSEVKVNSHNPDPLTPQVSNGLKSSPGNSNDNNKIGEPKSPSADDRGPRGYGTKPETAKIKMFIDHDSIPKTPIVIVKRGPANVEM